MKRTSTLRLTMMALLVAIGIIGALVSVPLSALLLGKNVGAFFFIPAFFISSLAGAILSLLLLPALKSALGQKKNKKGFSE